MESNLLKDIQDRAPNLTEADLPALAIECAEYYQSRIDAHASRVYGQACGVGKAAFREAARETLQKGLTTFLLRMEHWRNGRDINTYLLTCLKRLADQQLWDLSAAKKTSVLICPACRELGVRIFLGAEGKFWRCPNCTTEQERLVGELRNANGADAIQIRAKIQLHKAFAIHSRRGYRCPEANCSRFIPESLNGKFGAKCPYSDCDFFGELGSLLEMSHPTTTAHHASISLNESVGDADSSKVSVQDYIASETVTAEEKISIDQTFHQELKVLKQVIESQMETVRRMNFSGTRTQKILMYEAYRRMVETVPVEMVSYLCHLRQSAEVPIQARIFQEYCNLMEEALPFSFDYRGEVVDIVSLTDPILGLFEGKSVFTATVGENGKIPNRTIETYCGSRKYKFYGPYFIGKLLSVTDANGNNLMSHVKSYGFVDIDTDLPIGTTVTVTHYRIPPHYELGTGMVHLQRIRKHIVNRVYRLLNGNKRSIGRRGELKTA